jgi:segregation and condensation protein B
MELKLILEALLFNSQKPLSHAELRELLTNASGEEEDETVRAFRKVKPEEIEAALGQLAVEDETAGRSYRLVCVAGAWQFVSRPGYAPWVRALVGQKPRPPRLSQPALETLAIIAYRQPLTRAEMEQVRGVSVDGVMQTLLERGLIEQIGRAEVVGRPMTYGTTSRFLEYFGLRSLEDLPAADELRRLPTQKPPGLTTLEPGLATAPPVDLAAGNGQEPPADSSTAPEVRLQTDVAEPAADEGAGSEGSAGSR